MCSAAQKLKNTLNLIVNLVFDSNDTQYYNKERKA